MAKERLDVLLVSRDWQSQEKKQKQLLCQEMSM